MGVPADIDAKLTTTFPVAEPTFTLDSLLDLAHRVNPDLAASKSREYRAADMNVRVAQVELPAVAVAQHGLWRATRSATRTRTFSRSSTASHGAQSYASCVSLRLAPRRRRAARAGSCGTGIAHRGRSSHAVRAQQPAVQVQQGAVQPERVAVAAALQRLPARSEGRAGARRSATTRRTTSGLATFRSRPTSRRRTSTS